MKLVPVSYAVLLAIDVGVVVYKEPLTGDRQPSASQKFAITGTGYYYPGNKGELFSFRVFIGYKTPDFTDHSDTATCSGTLQ